MRREERRGEGLDNVAERREGMGFSLKLGRTHLEWCLCPCVFVYLCVSVCLCMCVIKAAVSQSPEKENVY